MKTVCLYSVTVLLAIMFFQAATMAQSDYYTPKSLLIPLHDQKNQLHLSVGRGGGYDVNLSFAFTDKLAVFSTATFDKDTKKRVSIFGDRYNLERNDYVLRGGLGYFTQTKNEYLSILEFYAGAGISKIDNHWYFTGNTDGVATQAAYWTSYAQVQAGKKFPKADYGFGFRIAYSNYTLMKYYDTAPGFRYRRIFKDNLWGLAAEPGFSFSYNLAGGLKLNIQTGLAVPLLSNVAQEYLLDPTTDTSREGNGVFGVDQAAFTGRLSLQYTLNFTKKDE